MLLLRVGYRSCRRLQARLVSGYSLRTRAMIQIWTPRWAPSVVSRSARCWLWLMHTSTPDANASLRSRSNITYPRSFIFANTLSMVASSAMGQAQQKPIGRSAYTLVAFSGEPAQAIYLARLLCCRGASRAHSRQIVRYHPAVAARPRRRGDRMRYLPAVAALITALAA